MQAEMMMHRALHAGRELHEARMRAPFTNRLHRTVQL